VPSSLQRAGWGQVRADAWRRDAGTPESQPPPWRRRVVSGARTRPGKLGDSGCLPSTALCLPQFISTSLSKESLVPVCGGTPRPPGFQLISLSGS